MIRLGTPADALGVAALHVRAWRAGFQEFIDAGTLPDADLVARESFWRHCLSLPSERLTVLVAEDPERGPIGVCMILPTAEDEDLTDPGIAQITVLYVDPVAWRTGTGRSLLTEGRRLMAQRGRHSLVLWTLTDHVATRAFYRAEGFRPDGAERPANRTSAGLIRLRAEVIAGRRQQAEKLTR